MRRFQNIPGSGDMMKNDDSGSGGWTDRLLAACVVGSFVAYLALSESLRVHVAFLVDSVRKVLRAVT